MTHRTATEGHKARRYSRNRPPGPLVGLVSNGWVLLASSAPLGPDVQAANLDGMVGSLTGPVGNLGWSDVAPRLVPLFDRVRPFLPEPSERVLAMVPPGIPITMGIDLGPVFAHVTTSMVDAWPVSPADVTAQALTNLHARASAVGPAKVVWGDIDGIPTGWLQTGVGIGSTLVLAPQELRRILGAEPRLLVAPMRDLLIALPPDEVEVATWLFAELASQDPNHLRPRLFGFDGRAVTVRAMG